MMMTYGELRRWSVVLAIAIAGCGPGTGGDGQDTGPGDSTSGTATSTTTASTTTASTTALPTGMTTAADSDTGTGVDTGVTDLPEQCSTFEQDCPPGFKCAPFANGGSNWNDSRCVPIVEDPDEIGEPCDAFGDPVDGEDSCALGAMCWDVDEDTSIGVCVPLCGGTVESPECPDLCQSCTITGDGSLTICLSGCDPLAQECPKGQSCFGVNDNFVCAPSAGSEAAIGEPCEFITSCEEGLACVSAAAVPDCDSMSGCCAPFCAVGPGDPCDALLPGTTCEPWFKDPKAGPPMECVSAEIGVCVML